MKDLQHQLNLKKKNCVEKIIQLNSATKLVGFVEVTMRIKGILLLCIHSHTIFMFKNKKTG